MKTITRDEAISQLVAIELEKAKTDYVKYLLGVLVNGCQGFDNLCDVQLNEELEMAGIEDRIQIE